MVENFIIKWSENSTNKNKIIYSKITSEVTYTIFY